MSQLRYTECEIDKDKLILARDGFESLHAKITGRGDGYNSITRPTGDEFSDLLGDGIKRLATGNQQSWGDSLLACLHAYGVLDRAAKATGLYNQKIDDLKARFAEARNHVPSEDLDSYVGVDRLALINIEARRAWYWLVEQCEEIEDILQDGPTAYRIRQLAEAGHFGDNEQIGYQSTGEADFMLVSAINPRLLAKWIRSTPTSEHDLGKLGEDHGLALLQSLERRAQYAEKNGLELSESEIQFYEDLYSELGANGDYDGFLGFLSWYEDRGDGFDGNKRQEIMRTLANGVLVLSNEQVGGAMGRLPEDIREAALGQTDNLDGLASLLMHSSPEIRGGTEFSTSLLRTSSDISPLDLEPLFSRPQRHEALQSLVSVATRNPEASNIILTGEDFSGNKYPVHAAHKHLTSERMLVNLYSVPWPDEGEAVRGLVGWITFEGDMARDIPAGAQNNAMVEFMKIMDNKAVVEALSSTKSSIEYEQGGHKGEWRGVSATQLNPELAAGLADLVFAYPEAFGNGTWLDPHNPVETGMRHNVPRLSAESRLALTQLAVSDPNTAARLYGGVRAMSTQAMSLYAVDATAAEIGGRTGVLTGLVEQALLNEADRRQENDEEAVARSNQARTRAADLGAALLVDLKVPNVVAVGLKQFVEDAWSVEGGGSASPHVPVGNDGVEKEYMTSVAIQALVAQDPSLMDQIESKYPGVVKGSGSGRRIPFSPQDWDHPDGGNIIDSILAEVGQEPWPGSEGETAKDAVNDYIGTFNTKRGQWSSWGNN
ncbi:hypothetical protein ABZ635_16035 [Nocardiopsis sp. NPDC007018]|uniref:TPR repeat region-containing protein n=1 Tax=Nocardiopsis sp. NPDC007018 TaxID=3155721 RepID=UPI0033FA4426